MCGKHGILNRKSFLYFRFFVFFSCDFLFSQCNYHHFLPNFIGGMTANLLSDISYENSRILLMHTVRIRMYANESSCWLVRVTCFQIMMPRDESERWVNLTCFILIHVKNTPNPLIGLVHDLQGFLMMIW